METSPPTLTELVVRSVKSAVVTTGTVGGTVSGSSGPVEEIHENVSSKVDAAKR